MPTTGNRPRLGSVPGRCKEHDGERAMNRAWIPAGALAGVSVAGLIALGQVTDSLSTPVSFPSSVAVTTPKPSASVRRSASPASWWAQTDARCTDTGGQASSQTPTSGDDRPGERAHPEDGASGATRPSRRRRRRPSPSEEEAEAPGLDHRRQQRRRRTATRASRAGGTDSTSTRGGLQSTPSADAPTLPETGRPPGPAW